MLSTAGLTGGPSNKPKVGTLLAPPPGSAGKVKSPLPPPPNDPATARMASGYNAGLNAPMESTGKPVDPLSDFSAIEV